MLDPETGLWGGCLCPAHTWSALGKYPGFGKTIPAPWEIGSSGCRLRITGHHTRHFPPTTALPLNQRCFMNNGACFKLELLV